MNVYMGQQWVPATVNLLDLGPVRTPDRSNLKQKIYGCHEGDGEEVVSQGIVPVPMGMECDSRHVGMCIWTRDQQ